MRAAVRGPKVPQNTMKPCADIVHFLITAEFWNGTPANRGTRCAANRREPTHLDKQPAERWLYTRGPANRPPVRSTEEPSPQRGPQPFQPLGGTALSLRSSSNNRDKQWIPFSRTPGTYTKKGLSAGACSVQMTAYHISSLPSRKEAKGQGRYRKNKNARWLDLDRLAFKIRSGVEKIYQVLYTFH